MNIEPLESRIAPAGVVALSIVGTTLKVLGDDAANVFTVTQLADGSVRFEALSGTQLRVGDNLQTDVQFTSAEGRSMSFELFAGSDEVIIAGLSLYKDLKVNAGSGDDELTLENVMLSGKLEIKGGAGANTVNLDGDFEIGGAFSYLGGDGADSILGSVSSFRTASALLDLKDGHNTVSISEANALWQLIESFRVIAGSGDDTVEFNGKSASLGGLDVNLGNGANSFKCGFDDIRDIGPLKLNSGTGADVFEITAANNLTIRKGITANLGGGSGDFQLAAGGNLSVRGATTVNFGDALDGQTDPNAARIGGRNINFGPLSFSVGQDTRIDSLIIAGYDSSTGVTADNPAQNITLSSLKTVGANAVVLNATNTITVRDSANIYSNNMGSGLLGVVSLTAAGVDIGKDLLFTGGAGDSEFTLAADSISIGGRLVLNLGDTATHEIGHRLAETGSHQIVNLGLPGGSLMAGSVLLASKNEVAIETLEIVASGRIETIGAFTVVDGGGSANVTFADADLDIGKSFTLALGAGNSTVAMEGGLFRAGSVSMTSAAIAPDWEVISLGYEEISFTLLSVQTGAGASSFTLDADRGRIGTALINLGAGANNASMESGGGLRIGKLIHQSQSGVGEALDRLALEGMRVNETVTNLGLAASILRIANCSIGKLTANLGAGADIARLDDNTFTGDVGILGGFGADSIRIDRDTTESGASHFFGRVAVALGGGDDELLVANMNPETKANFYRAVTVDGGEGTDTFTPHATNAVFAIAAILTNVE